MGSNTKFLDSLVWMSLIRGGKGGGDEGGREKNINIFQDVNY